jgi:LL-diaminopimelate aminotransferase
LRSSPDLAISRCIPAARPSSKAADQAWGCTSPKASRIAWRCHLGESPGYDEEKFPGSTFHILLPLQSEPPDAKMARLLSPLLNVNLRKKLNECFGQLAILSSGRPTGLLIVQKLLLCRLNQQIVAALRKSGRGRSSAWILARRTWPPTDFIVDKLVEQPRRSDTHAYTPMAARPSSTRPSPIIMAKRFGVELTPQKETLLLLGSKEGLFALSQVLLNPGDISPDPRPGLPNLPGWRRLPAQRFPMPLLSENNFLPDLKAIPAEIARRAKVMWLNYPNNPTGAVAPLSSSRKWWIMPKSTRFVIAHDAPYVDVCFDGYRAPSILEVPGAKDVAVEFNSLSKTYNMAGWRIGHGSWQPKSDRLPAYLQEPGRYGSLWPDYHRQYRRHHRRPELDRTAQPGSTKERRDTPSHAARSRLSRRNTAGSHLCLGAPARALQPTRWISARAAQRYRCQHDPWAGLRRPVEGYVRVSLCTPNAQIEEAMQRMQDWMKDK